MTIPRTERPEATVKKLNSSYGWAPLLVLFLGVAATALATYSVGLTSVSRDQLRLQTAVSTTTNLVQERLAIYSSLLRGGSALFAATGKPSLDQFRGYADRLGLREVYPGIQGFGFAKRTFPFERSELQSAMRQQGHPEFVITPEGERPVYYPIVFLEPLDRRNQAAIGYDMFAEEVRHEAMSRARDEGQPVASGKVELVQEIDPVKQPGFLLYMPVYLGGGIPETVLERREKIQGFVYSPFRVHDLFEAIFPQVPAEVNFDVYDGSEIIAEKLLYKSNPDDRAESPISVAVPFTFAGHQWTIQFHTTPAFSGASHRFLIPWVFFTGLALSVLLFAITSGLTRAHRRLEKAEADLKNHIDLLEETVAKRTARLRETVSELEHMSYSIVHDMRAPLRAIQSFGVMLEEEAGPVLSAECRDYISRMRRAATRMDALIRDVLNYGKLVEQELPLYPVDVPHLLRGIVESYPIFQAADAQIEIDPDIPAVLANEAALTQCFSNLLSNALKFTKPGVKPRIAIKGEHRNGLVRLSVTDNGIGIPQDLQQKVFQMFQRLDNSKEGTGIGLAIVRKAAERMGGSVILESQPGIGTRFILELRSASAHSEAKPRRN